MYSPYHSKENLRPVGHHPPSTPFTTHQPNKTKVFGVESEILIKGATGAFTPRIFFLGGYHSLSTLPHKVHQIKKIQFIKVVPLKVNRDKKIQT